MYDLPSTERFDRWNSLSHNWSVVFLKTVHSKHFAARRTEGELIDEEKKPDCSIFTITRHVGVISRRYIQSNHKRR